MNRIWTEEEKVKAADLVTSYVDGLGRALNEFSVEQDELDEMLLNMNIEQCPGCGWYTDCHDLIPADHDEPDGQCDNCR